MSAAPGSPADHAVGSGHNQVPELIWGTVGGLVLMTAAAVFTLWPESLSLLPVCGFKHLTGLPCLACGGTRAALALAGGHPLQALALNPLLAVGLVAASFYVGYAWLVVAGGLRPLRTGWLSPPMPKALRWTIIVLVLLNWAYLIAAGR